ncbi:unnamed protein product [Closterium sp. Yama58-4]|nr:unnamed protein product [Closterium sp. Yama58-4]
MLAGAMVHGVTDRRFWAGEMVLGRCHRQAVWEGEFVLELALAEMLLQAGLDRLVFPGALLMRASPTNLRQLAAKLDPDHPDMRPLTLYAVARSPFSHCRSVFTSLIASAYLTRGMPEVYRLLFEVFGLDPHHPDMLPKIVPAPSSTIPTAAVFERSDMLLTLPPNPRSPLQECFHIANCLGIPHTLLCALPPHPGRSVFTSLIASAYLTRGMPEVYRLLFEVFGLDPDHPEMQPKIERVRDEDFLHADLDGDPLTWRDVACYQPPPDSLFPNPRLFHACVPPGMSRFRGSDWMHRSLEAALRALAWPMPAEAGMTLEAKQRRNEDMVMALQLCFIHPSLYRAEHPRFCYDRLEYVGQKIQDLVLAENLLQSHLDAPILWLSDRHTKLLRNRACGRYLRASGLHDHVELSEESKQYFYANKKFQNLVSGAVFQAVHGAAYIVYGKPEVRRLMFGMFEIDGGTMHTM